MKNLLKILNEHGKDLYPEELDLLETELDTGDEYSEIYVKTCKERINALRAWLRGDEGAAEPGAQDDTEQLTEPKVQPVMKDGGPVIMNQLDILPDEARKAAQATMTIEQQLSKELSALRQTNTYKSDFKRYIEKRPEIDSAFLDTHFSLFTAWEMDAIVTAKELPEDFLEKYFGVLDHDKIARCQRFSESFFMKHYADLNPEIVLKRGKNDWRKKEKRSKQLDVFLRLKGVNS